MVCDLPNMYSTTKANKDHGVPVTQNAVLPAQSLCSLLPISIPPLDEEGSWGFSLTPGKTMATLISFAIATSLPASNKIRTLHIDEVMQEVTEALPVGKCLSLIWVQPHLSFLASSHC